MKNTGIWLSLRGWYLKLKPQTKAALRTAFQATVAALLTFVLALMSIATGIISGDIEASWELVSNAFKVLLIALVSVVSGLVSYLMNRNSGIQYDSNLPPPVPPPKT